MSRKRRRITATLKGSLSVATCLLSSGQKEKKEDQKDMAEVGGSYKHTLSEERQKELMTNARNIAIKGKGILAADESTSQFLFHF